MNTSIALFIFLTALIFLRSAINLFELVSNMVWLQKNEIKHNKTKFSKDSFIICIPMLREQNIIQSTLEYFSKLNYPKNKYKVIIVTTAKEKRKTQELSTTYELAKLYSFKINNRLGTNLIKIVNYSGEGNLMSHQINHVIKKVTKIKKNLKSIFAVYNADSRPNLNTLNAISETLYRYQKSTGVIPNIIQQSSIFSLNYNSLPRSLSGYILRAAAVFQTKWTLIHELSRFRKQSQKSINKNKNLLSELFDTQLSHCVGHGLFVRLDLLSKEFLPTETLNEDLPFGYYQCCKREPILPFYMLENSEVPSSFGSLINQKRVWFFPYLEYTKCQKRVIKLKRYKSLLEVYLLTLQGQITGFIWLLQSAILFTPLIIALYLHTPTFLIAWSLSIFLYWFLPVGIIYLKLSFLERLAGKIKTEVSLLDYIFSSFAGIVILITHSVGPVLAVNNFVTAKYFNRPVIKSKTER